MIGLKLKHILLFSIPLLGLLFQAPVLCEGSEEESERPRREPIVITSDSLELDNSQKVVTFTGNVDARNDIFILSCQKVLLYYLNPESSKKPDEENLKIDRIVATGNVKIIRISGGEAMAEKAVYYQNDEKVVLTGQPIVKQGDNFIEGSKITFFLKESRSIVEGSRDKQVRAVLSPESKKRIKPIGR